MSTNSSTCPYDSTKVNREVEKMAIELECFKHGNGNDSWAQVVLIFF